jgi:DNA-binding MarR family transcriptional regulator
MDKHRDSGAGLIALVTQISKALHRRTTEELLGLRLKQFMVLGYVRDHGNGGVSQQELETAMLIDANAVVLLLNELEAAGMSVRKRDPHDRRRHLVEITESGKAALDRAERAREGLEEEILAELSPEERATLRKLLRRVLDGLLRAVPEPVKA